MDFASEVLRQSVRGSRAGCGSIGPMRQQEDWYAYLNIAPDAPTEQVEQAVERLSRQATALAVTAPERSQRLRDTVRSIKRDLLSGAEARARYDAGREAAATAAQPPSPPVAPSPVPPSPVAPSPVPPPPSFTPASGTVPPADGGSAAAVFRAPDGAGSRRRRPGRTGAGRLPDQAVARRTRPGRRAAGRGRRADQCAARPLPAHRVGLRGVREGGGAERQVLHPVRDRHQPDQARGRSANPTCHMR